jgi:hypothetical protein
VVSVAVGTSEYPTLKYAVAPGARVTWVAGKFVKE